MQHDCNHKVRMPSCWNTKNIYIYIFFYSITVMFIFLLRVDPTSILEKIFNLWDLWSLFVNVGNSEGPASSGCCGVNQCFRLRVLSSLVGSICSEVVPLLKAVTVFASSRPQSRGQVGPESSLVTVTAHATSTLPKSKF